jgi:hypothetical protein
MRRAFSGQSSGGMINEMKSAKTLFAVTLTLVICVSLSFFIGVYERNHAFVYISILWFLSCLFLSLIIKSNLRLWALYIGAGILALGLFEAWLTGWFPWQNRGSGLEYIAKGGYFRSHSILGYAPKKNRQARGRKYHGKKKIYDVSYTIDPNGFRVGPNRAGVGHPSVLFFGGSFTFGDGVNDDEAMPYRFEAESNGAFKSFNFGFHGYGPHQMLAILENGMEKNIVRDYPPKFAVYFAIPEHIERCAGNAYWDPAGPRYVLNADGNPEYTGPFYGFFRRNLMKVMNRAQFLIRFISAPKKRTPADIDRFVAIVKASKEIFNERYAGKFYVLLWDTGDAAYSELLSKLSENQIAVIKINEILPGHSNSTQYIIPHDGHPNQLAYKQIAESLYTFLLREVPDEF